MPTNAARDHASEHGYFYAGGAACCFSTNSAEIMQAVRRTFLPAHAAMDGDGFRVDIFVTANDSPAPLWKQPYFRGLEHMVVASFGPHDFLFFNQLTKHVRGRISPAMANDSELWQNTILPLMVGTMGPVCGVTPLHCACLVKGGEGTLLAGRSGTGKSTLTYALSRMGFEFLSDDWTYFSRQQGEVSAWGLPIPAKLLPDTTRFFPELRGHQPIDWLNGESAISADPVALGGTQRSLRCTPRRIFILERRSGPKAEFVPLAWEKALQWFESGVQQLPASLSRFRADQLRTIQQLAERECWILRFSGSPQEVAQALAEFCENPRENPSSRALSPNRMDARVPDLLRRFTPTPLQCDLRIRNEAIALETNSAALLKTVRELAIANNETPASPGIRWRIVADSQLASESKFGDFDYAKAALPCVTFSGPSFLAFDEQHLMGIGFIAASALRRKDFVHSSLLPAISSLLQRTSRTTEAA